MIPMKPHAHLLTRRNFLKAAGAGATSLAMTPLTGLGADAPSGKRPPNVVLIVADDQRNDTIAAWGNDHIHTPNLDRLARSGFSFTAARCMGAQTGAVCIPARAMLNTGRSLFRVPENMGRFTTIGQALRSAGYETFHAGKWHNGTPAFVRSYSAGGNIFFGGMNANQYKVRIHDFNPAGKYPADSIRIGNKFSSELFANAAVEFISRQKNASKPFYCYLAFTSPHDPRTPPAPYSTMYDPARMPLPKNWLPEHPFDNGELSGRDERLAPFPRTKPDTKKQLCDYYGMISSQDEQVGRVLAALESAGQMSNTLIVYTGDHGLSIGSHGLFGKQSVYEEAQHVPLIFSGLGVPGGKSSAAISYGFDIFPTIFSLIGMTPPKSVEGSSLTRIISGSAQKVRDTFFGAYIHPVRGGHPYTQHSACDGQWKLIRYDVKGKTTLQLFDLENDPTESRDLAQDGVAQKQIPRLRELLDHSQKMCEEPRELIVEG